MSPRLAFYFGCYRWLGQAAAFAFWSTVALVAFTLVARVACGVTSSLVDLAIAYAGVGVFSESIRRLALRWEAHR